MGASLETEVPREFVDTELPVMPLPTDDAGTNADVSTNTDVDGLRAWAERADDQGARHRQG